MPEHRQWSINMTYHVANRTEAAGTIKAGFKSGVAEYLAEGTLVLCPPSDHDTLADELYRQLHNQAIIFDVSEMVAKYIESSLDAPDLNWDVELPAVVYITTDSSIEPAGHLMDQAIRMTAGLASFRPSDSPAAHPRAVSMPHRSPPRPEAESLSGFVTTSDSPAQFWLYSLLSRILTESSHHLFRCPPASPIFLHEFEGFWRSPGSSAVVRK
jgi:hypothetical protein